jgi:threonine dehydratase
MPSWCLWEWGLLSGTVIAAIELFPRIRVIAGEPVGADDAFRSLAEGRIVRSEGLKTIADGLLTSLGNLTFPVIQDRVERIVTVSEASIVAVMKFIWECAKLVIEPSAAAPLAILWERRIDLSGLKVGVIVSGATWISNPCPGCKGKSR